MSPLELATPKSQLTGVAGECDRNCAILQDDILTGLGIDVRRTENFQKKSEEMMLLCKG